VSDLRPLDRLRSIKVKLGLLVVASCAAASLTTWYGVVVLAGGPATRCRSLCCWPSA
jgi:hypothetical protein